MTRRGWIRSAALGLASSIALLTGAGVARAHPLALGVLRVVEQDDGTIDLAYRFSGTEARASGAEPVLPRRCRAIGVATERALAEGGLERRARFTCGAEGLGGSTIAVRGLEGSGVEIVVRVERAEGVIEARLDDRCRELIVPARSGGVGLAAWIAMGAEHVLGGADHLLFVLGLLLLAWRGGAGGAAGARDAARVAATITAFTAGHSVTLALAALGAVTLPAAPVEACIALSVLIVASELATSPPDARAPAAARPWTLAGAFGLLHGLGFAGALRGAGLPRDGVAAALLGFNVGVELGQLAFVAGCALVLALAVRGGVARARARARSVLALGIGGVSVYLLLDRLSALGASG